ncbi:hypothetical protein FH972_006535 [Carpinus fangiana]|uniref:Uncharacterized protein n=1 Tax=Carpinus fangiana TaxID=176857 RepID=A0A5N6QSL0_9ROSI|nr:hypothetical protein FH972_006535 [Carpinus fangiana]
MANSYSIQVDQPNPSMPLLQNQQDHVNHQASIAESPPMVIVQPSTPPPNQFMNIDQSLPQSNPPPMVPPSTSPAGSVHHATTAEPTCYILTSPAGSVHHATTAEPTYYILTNPSIGPFPYINGPNLGCDQTWAQPTNPPPNHDPADNMVQQQIQQPILSAQPQPMNPMIGAPPPPQPPRECSNHDLQETQETPSKSAPPPCDSPILQKSQPSPPPESPFPKPVSQVQILPSSTAGRGVSKKRNVPNTAASLANLLPTGTVLVFQALVPSLTGNGKCQIFNKYLVGFVIAFCAATCFLSSFTDSFKHGDKLYYGIATCKELCVFNYDGDEEKSKIEKDLLKSLKLKPPDFFHAFGSLIVFLIFAVSSTDVLLCFFPEADRENEYSIVIYLPLVAGALSSFLFTYFPTERKGLGYTDTPR